MLSFDPGFHKVKNVLHYSLKSSHEDDTRPGVNWKDMCCSNPKLINELVFECYTETDFVHGPFTW